MKKTTKSGWVLVSVFCLLLVGMFVAFLVTPKIDFSEKEKKVLATMPRLTVDSLTDGSYFSGIDSYISDHFPLREMWVGATAYGNLLTGRNGNSGIYHGKDGYLIPTPFTVDTVQLSKNQLQFEKFCQNTAAEFYYMPVPSSGSVLADKLPKNHLSYPDEKVYQALERSIGKHAALIDLRGPLAEAAVGEQVFYRTDHHWTSAGAFAAYQAYLKQVLPSAAVPEKQAYQIETIPDFYGTSYAKSGLWLNGPDEIALWQNPALKNLSIEITDDDQAQVQTTDSFFDRTYDSKADKYPVFLGGNHSLVKITNPDAATNKKILLLKDSFANSVAPFLAEHYQEVYLVDLRYSRQRSVSELVKAQGIDTVLFLYSTDDFANDSNFMWLK